MAKDGTLDDVLGSEKYGKNETILKEKIKNIDRIGLLLLKQHVTE